MLLQLPQQLINLLQRLLSENGAVKPKVLSSQTSVVPQACMIMASLRQICHWCVGSKAKSQAEKQQEGIAEEARAVWTLDEEKLLLHAHQEARRHKVFQRMGTWAVSAVLMVVLLALLGSTRRHYVYFGTNSDFAVAFRSGLKLYLCADKVFRSCQGFE